MEIQVRDLRVHYQVEGRGRALLLVHGGGVDLEAWEPQIPWLREQFTLYRADLRGYGKSQNPPGRAISAEDWVLDLKGFVDAIGLDRPSVIGWALGGSIAARYAARFPDRVTFIAMLGSPGPTRRPKMGGIQSREELVRAGATPDEIIERTFEYTRAAFSPAALARNPRAADSLKAALRRNFPANYSELVKAFSDAIPSLLELGQVRCPALIVVGEDDARTPPDMSVEIAKAIDGAYLKVLRECGHFYAYEQPEACARTIIEFDRFVHAQSLEER